MHNSVISFALFFTCVAAYSQPSSVPTVSNISDTPSIGYQSVGEALETLKANPGVQVQITKPDSWIIINEPGNKQWSFTPETHSAYPAVVRRVIKIDAKGEVFIEMTALCESTKPNCDKLVQDFKALNEQMQQSIQNRLKPIGSK
jgi:hypothetical protein